MTIEKVKTKKMVMLLTAKLAKKNGLQGCPSRKSSSTSSSSIRGAVSGVFSTAVFPK